MSKVMYNMSASLDGFVRARGYSPSNPLGEGGDRLHQWFFADDAANREFAETMLASVGAVVAGRTTYDDSAWGANGPTGPHRVPTMIVTHDAPASPPADGVYTFVTTGIEAAVAAAREVADGKDVSIMGGPSMGCQALAAGLVDEIVVSVVPILFGGGLPMFANLPRHIELETVSVLNTSSATHMTYRVLAG